jgi:hypothetical protein
MQMAVPSHAEFFFSRNTSITKISCPGIDAQEGFAELGEALKANPSNALTELNLSFNKIGEKVSNRSHSYRSTPILCGMFRFCTVGLVDVCYCLFLSLSLSSCSSSSSVTLT